MKENKYVYGMINIDQLTEKVTKEDHITESRLKELFEQHVLCNNRLVDKEYLLNVDKEEFQRTLEKFRLALTELVGKHTCGKKTEVYSRVVGYFRPVDNWNKGKQEEFKMRKTFGINKK